MRPERYANVAFNAPLSDARANAIVKRLAASAPGSILDVGCGWGELLLRLAAACPTATARGVDTDESLLARGRANAAARALTVAFDRVPAADVTEPCDVVICVGSSHAFGESTSEALGHLRSLVRPGGRLLYGGGTWEQRGPCDRTLVWDDMLALPSLAGLVDVAVEAGFGPLWIETAQEDELFAFESGFLADVEAWLLSHDDRELRGRNDEHRKRWLHGYRNGFGFAYLTLGVRR